LFGRRIDRAKPRPADGHARGSATKPGGGADATRRVYDEYLRARRAGGQSTAGLTYEKVAHSLDAQRQRLKKQHGHDREVDFEVVTKNGRTVIRPVVK